MPSPRPDRRPRPSSSATAPRAACARRADAGVRQQIAAALATIEAAFADPARARPYEATTEFYRLIFTAAGHHIAWEIVQRLNGRISRLRALTLGTSDRQTSGPAHMARIARAIGNRDADAAAQAVRDHLDDAARLARTLLVVPE
jgi:DNA-binding GntR family transcriptional regulator